MSIPHPPHTYSLIFPLDQKRYKIILSQGPRRRTIIFEGQICSNGSKNGSGMSFYSSRPNEKSPMIKYKGCYQNNQRSGYGTQYTQGGNILYYGEFKNGRLDGEGSINFPDSEQLLYQGGFTDNKFSGHGVSFYKIAVGESLPPAGVDSKIFFRQQAFAFLDNGILGLEFGAPRGIGEIRRISAEIFRDLANPRCHGQNNLNCNFQKSPFWPT